MDFSLTPETIRAGLLFYILLVACLGLRAYAQAWLADRLGDPTPREEGRLTLNLIVHMDLVGSVILPLICIFYLQPRIGQVNFFLAWTKPIPINASNFRSPHRDFLFTQLAGTGMSLLLALLAATIGGFVVRYQSNTLEVFDSLISINAMLIVLDLLPLPPLPGAMILRHWGIISEERFWQFARWSGLVLLIALNIPVLRLVLAVMIALVQLPFEQLFHGLAHPVAP